MMRKKIPKQLSLYHPCLSDKTRQKLHVETLMSCFSARAASKVSFSIMSSKFFAYRLKLCWAQECLAQLVCLGRTARLQQMNSLSPLMLSRKKLHDRSLKKQIQTLLISIKTWPVALHYWDLFLILILIQIL